MLHRVPLLEKSLCRPPRVLHGALLTDLEMLEKFSKVAGPVGQPREALHENGGVALSLVLQSALPTQGHPGPSGPEPRKSPKRVRKEYPGAGPQKS